MKLPNGFLEQTDDTGRFLVYSERTGKTYAVEPIWRKTANWGSIDPATKELTNKKGFMKHRGAVREENSLMHEGQGFINVQMLEPGTSPLHAIHVMDAKYLDKQSSGDGKKL